MIDPSKALADFLRKTYPGLKASHAHELVAAWFGYNKRASYLADKNPNKIGGDVVLLETRRHQLKDLAQLPSSPFLALSLLAEYSRLLDEAQHK